MLAQIQSISSTVTTTVVPQTSTASGRPAIIALTSAGVMAMIMAGAGPKQRGPSKQSLQSGVEASGVSWNPCARHPGLKSIGSNFSSLTDDLRIALPRTWSLDRSILSGHDRRCLHPSGCALMPNVRPLRATRCLAGGHVLSAVRRRCCSGVCSPSDILSRMTTCTSTERSRRRRF